MKADASRTAAMKASSLAALMIALALLGCRGEPQAAGRDSLDAIARDYVLLSLTIGEKEPGYIDAYYGPPELQAQAKADGARQSLEALAKRTTEMSERVASVEKGVEG